MTACLMIFVMFFQVIAHLFDTRIFKDWFDEYFLDVFVSFCNYVRLIGAVNESGDPAYYWILVYFSLSYTFIIVCLLVYTNYALRYP